MNISLITVFHELYHPFLETSLIGRAQNNNLLNCDIGSYFSYVQPKERIDAPTIGPGPGMLLRPDIIEKFVEEKELRYGKAFKIFFSPQGTKLDQTLLTFIAQKMQETKHLMLFPARYEGMDARVEEEYADLVVSLGDFVIMAGDLPAMVLLEGVIRLLPNVVGNQESIEHESFTGPFVDYPEFTMPLKWKNREVPDLLRSGNHAAIKQWREEKAAEKSVKLHFDWVRSCKTDGQQNMLVRRYIPPHYCVLMHDEIVLPGNQIGTTSVTSLDIHDIARSMTTYGLQDYFIVTPLADQKKIVTRLLEFWKTGVGIDYNPHRHEAVSKVHVEENLQAVIQKIEEKEGKSPILIATSARSDENGASYITYYDQAKVWRENRPVLFVFGTGRGLAPSIIKKCDYMLLPVEGFSDFNHLSVRSAAAVIFDRWLGINLKER